MHQTKYLNLAIVAHVDHGKTTLVDAILKQSNVFRENQNVQTCVMDSNSIEKERGITIFSKVAKVVYKDFLINIIDTPGHADFSTEVERIMSMVDGVILLVDAKEGPMPQTHFVFLKAIESGLKIIAVLNKVDAAEVFDVKDTVNNIESLLLESNKEEYMYSPIMYASGKNGWCSDSLEEINQSDKNLTPLFEKIINYFNVGEYDRESHFSMLSSFLEHNSHLGQVITGKIYSGTAKVGDKLKVLSLSGDVREEFKVSKFFKFDGISKVEAESVEAGDIVCICGMKGLVISDTICSVEIDKPIPSTPLTPPIISIGIGVDDAPKNNLDKKSASTSDKKVTSSAIRQRLLKEAERNVGIVVSDSEVKDFCIVKGRGELQLSILIENMKREGYFFSISKPEVIMRKNEEGELEEPIEMALISMEDQYSGAVVREIGLRYGEIVSMVSSDNRTVIKAFIPARCLIGYNSKFLTDTRGTGILNRTFDSYKKYKGEFKPRNNGSLISINQGKVTAYSLSSLQDRGIMFVSPGDFVYEGMIVGEHNRDNDLDVNVTKPKQLTNMRASGTDETIKIVPAKKIDVAEFLSYINNSELIEVSDNIRLRKKTLSQGERKRLKK